MSLMVRSLQPELMDSKDYSFDELVQCLRQLRLINVLTGGYAPTLSAIERLTRERTDNLGDPVRILDLGYGYGDMLRKIWRWAQRIGLDVELSGTEINPWAQKIARTATPPEMKINYLSMDVFEADAVESYDIVINSLFMHHLGDDEIVNVLRWMTASSRLGWFVNDLHRHPFAFHFIKGFTRILPFNRMIRHDAPVSVARAFARADWARYIENAQLMAANIEIRWHWSFRYGLLYRHHGGGW